MEIEQIREELDRAQQKSSLTDELEKDNHQTKNKIETYKNELQNLNEENAKITEAKLSLILEKDELTKSLAQKEADLKKLKDDLQAAEENIEDLKNSLVKAGKALDDSIADKETLESEYNKKLDDFEAEMKQQKKQWDSEKNEVKQQKEILQQSSEAAMSKLQVSLQAHLRPGLRTDSRLTKMSEN